MATYLLYFSPTGGTRKILREIVKGISNFEKLTEVDLTIPDNRDMDIVLEEDDLLVVGTPVYSGRIPAILDDCFRRIKGNATKAILVAVYGNRHFDDALIEMKDIFEGQGFLPVAAAAFIAEHSYSSQIAKGRPDGSDLSRAIEFGRSVFEKLENKRDIVPIAVSGNRPYKERSAKSTNIPDTDESCTQCKICAEECPTAAINLQDCSEVDEEKCILCCNCIKTCPISAKEIHSERFDMIVNWLMENAGKIRREPEIFM